MTFTPNASGQARLFAVAWSDLCTPGTGVNLSALSSRPMGLWGVPPSLKATARKCETVSEVYLPQAGLSASGREAQECCWPVQANEAGNSQPQMPRRSIPRIITWCRAPGASHGACHAMIPFFHKILRSPIELFKDVPESVFCCVIFSRPCATPGIIGSRIYRRSGACLWLGLE
jgi:hypothetical protein